MRYDPERAAAFYDDYGVREWRRFEQPWMGPASLDVHVHYLRHLVGPGDLVLDAGAGPRRFTIELARLGTEIVVADLSPGQLELNREKVDGAEVDDRVRDRVVGDVTDLSAFADEHFDAAVCYGGPLSYVVDHAAVAELVRVVKPGGRVLVSVMSLVGAVSHSTDVTLELVVRDGAAQMEEIVRTGFLPEEPDFGDLPMRLFRWRELHELLVRLELDLGAEPVAIDGGEHLLAVLRKP